MAGLFGGPKIPPNPPPPEPPRPVRMPVETDRNVQAAVDRNRQANLRRSGRLSTILTDSTTGTAGYGAGGRQTLGG